MSVMGKATATMIVGRVLAIGVGFAAVPWLTRLYAPAQFGVAQLVTSVSSWVGAFACLGYAIAIPLSTDRSETRSLVILCLALTAVLVVPVALLTLAGAAALSRWTGEPQLQQLLWFVPAMFLTVSLTHIGQYTCSKEGRFGALSASYFAQDGLKAPIQIVLALCIGAGAAQLLWGTFLGNLCGAAVAATSLVGVLRTPDGQPLADVARRHEQFPKIQMWTGVVNVASRVLPIVLLGAVFSSTVVGYYSLGYKVLGLPLAVLGMSVARTFYPQAAEEWRESETVTDSVSRSVLMLSTTCVFPLAAVALLGPFLFQFVFGARWGEAGVYAQLLAPWMFTSMIASPLGVTFLIARRAGLALAYNVALLVGRPSALIVGGWIGGERIAVLCVSMLGVVVQCHAMLEVKKMGRVQCNITAIVLRDTVFAVLLLLPAAAAYWALGSAPLCIALLAVATCVHGAVAYKRAPLLQRGVRSFLAKLRPGWGKTEDNDPTL